MKDIFSWRRFAMVLCKDAQDLQAKFIKLLLLIASPLIALFFLSLAFGKTYDVFSITRLVVSALFIFGSILFAPFQLYKHYNHKIKGVNYFMLPASQTEKFFSMLLYCIIVTPLIAVLTFALTDMCLYPFYPWDGKELWIHSAFSKLCGPAVKENGIVALFAFQSIILLGNAWFRRAKIQKTILIIIVFIFICIILGTALRLDMETAGVIQKGDVFIFDSVNFKISGPWFIVSKILNVLLIPVGLWFVSFLKIKEQEI